MKFYPNLNDYYRKIRNCFRFILGNIDNTIKVDIEDYDKLSELDKYILAKVFDLNERRSSAIKEHSYHNFYKYLFEFCSIDLSSFYFDISKDILYCNSLDSKERNSIISVLYHLYDNLTTWFAPVLCHTMEETWKELKTEKMKSVHLKTSKKLPDLWEQNELINKWKLVRKIRRLVNTAIENVRNKKMVGSSLEVEIYIYVGDDSLKNTLQSIEIKKILMVARFIFLKV